MISVTAKQTIGTEVSYNMGHTSHCCSHDSHTSQSRSKQASHLPYDSFKTLGLMNYSILSVGTRFWPQSTTYIEDNDRNCKLVCAILRKWETCEKRPVRSLLHDGSDPSDCIVLSDVRTATSYAYNDITRNIRPQRLLISPRDTMAFSTTSCRSTSRTRNIAHTNHYPCTYTHANTLS